MNPEQRQLNQINMSCRFKNIAIGIILYVVATYAWKVYKNKSE